MTERMEVEWWSTSDQGQATLFWTQEVESMLLYAGRDRECLV